MQKNRKSILLGNAGKKVADVLAEVPLGQAIRKQMTLLVKLRVVGLGECKHAVN